jgi:hypothetical protein
MTGLAAVLLVFQWLGFHARVQAVNPSPLACRRQRRSLSRFGFCARIPLHVVYTTTEPQITHSTVSHHWSQPSMYELTSNMTLEKRFNPLSIQDLIPLMALPYVHNISTHGNIPLHQPAPRPSPTRLPHSIQQRNRHRAVRSLSSVRRSASIYAVEVSATRAGTG